MKRFALFCLFVFICYSNLKAQSWQRSFKGRVVDSSSLKPIADATISIFSAKDTMLLNFGFTTPNGNFTLTETWKHKAQGYMSTPVVIDGVAYNHLKSQRIMAIEVESGRELWTSDQSFGKYMSLVAQGDRILALDQRGQLFLFRANKQKFEQIDKRKLTDAETWAHLASAGDQLFVRELNALTAYQWRGRDSKAALTP